MYALPRLSHYLQVVITFAVNTELGTSSSKHSLALEMMSMDEHSKLTSMTSGLRILQ